jgi:23S rRNA pseudoU1915 N3-methylase RlmH
MSAGYSTVVVELGQPSDLQDPDDDTAESGSELVLSLSPLALSADLVALLAAEQIYRAFRILGNQPYHK